MPPHNFTRPMNIKEANNIILEELSLMEIKHSSEAKTLPDTSKHNGTGEVYLSQAEKVSSFFCKHDSYRLCTENQDVNGSNFFSISLHGLHVATVEVGNDAYQGNRLLEFVKPLLSLSKEQIIAMDNAKKALYEDIDWMKDNYGVNFYDPNAMPFAFRFPENKHQRLYVTLAAHQISDCFLVKPTEFVLGRSDYEDSSIYQQGDLQRLFVANKEVFEKCKVIAISNLEKQTEQEQISRCSLIVQKFESSSSIQL